MRRILLMALFLILSNYLKAQSIAPENVTGKIYMRNGNNSLVKGNHPIPGHQLFDPSDPPKVIPPSNFTQFDANMKKLFEIVKAVPDLNPPVGFDAWYQINNFHRDAKGMYYGWLRVWMFAYEINMASKKIMPGGETGVMVWAYANDPTVLRGRHEYFTDTLQHVEQLSNGIKLVDIPGQPKMEIFQKPKALFVPYTVGAFLQKKINYYQQQENQWKKELAKSQDNLAQMSKVPNQSDLQKQFNRSLKATYQKSVDMDQQKLNDIRGKLQLTNDQDNKLSETQKTEQAFVKPSGSISYANPEAVGISDEWDDDEVTLLPPGDYSGKALYCYNPEYFDKSRPSDLQLIILTYQTEGDGPILNKQWQIIQQVNADKLQALLR